MNGFVAQPGEPDVILTVWGGASVSATAYYAGTGEEVFTVLPWWGLEMQTGGEATVVYNFAPAPSVPLPAAGWAGLGVLAALGATRRLRRRRAG